jgi:ubiquinone/menaquinone biosynthesis C-methylase UbiE
VLGISPFGAKGAQHGLTDGGERLTSTTKFKSCAWASKESADRYHENTVASPKIFQLIREDLYIRYVQRHAKPGARILDLGCGSGLVSIRLHDLGFKVVSCDISQGMRDELAEERGARDFELRRGSGFDIPAADGEFDMVVSRMFIQHFPDWPKVLQEKARVTCAGGIVLFDFGNREHVDACDPNLGRKDGFPYCTNEKQSGSFYAVASEDEMRREAGKCGLDVVEIVPFGFLLYNAFVWKSLGAAAIPAFNDELDQLLSNEGARELMFFLEERVLPLLPKSTSYGNLTVLRRNPAPSTMVAKIRNLLR